MDIKINKKNTKLAKSFDEDKRIFTSIVLKANQYDDDGVNQDFWSYEVVEEAAYDFMLKSQQGNVGHVMNTDLVKVVESYIAPTSFSLGAGEVDKGDWVLSVKIIDDDLWGKCKEGVFKGFSIGCGATVEEEE